MWSSAHIGEPAPTPYPAGAGRLVPLGFEPEDRAFHPHLTLARARGPRGDPGLARCAAALENHAFGVFPARSITLYHSELHASGARHRVIERCGLGVAT